MLLLKNFYNFISKYIYKVVLGIILVITGFSIKFYIDANRYFGSQEFLDYYIKVNKSFTNTVTDSSGELLGFSSSQYREPVSTVPPLLEKAILLVEDRTFYENNGISFTGTFRAVFNLIPSLMRKENPGGGSTITQQLVRTMVLSQKISLLRKWKEIIYSLVLTKKASKKEILLMYVNSAYFGQNLYGFSTAAKFFFGIPLNDLNAMQVSILVAMLKDPRFSLFDKKRFNRLNERFKYILRKLNENKLIDDLAYSDYLSYDICKLSEESLKKSSSYLTKYTRSLVIEKYGEKVYNSGGLVIKTSINKKMQLAAEEIFEDKCLEFELRRKWQGPVGKMKNFDASQLIKFQENYGILYSAAYMLNKEGDYVFYNGLKGKLSSDDLDKYQAVTPVLPGHVVVIHKKKNLLCNPPVYTGQVTISDINTGELLVAIGGVDVNRYGGYSLLENPRHIGSVMKVFGSLYLLNNEKCSTSSFVNDLPGQVVNNRFEYISQSSWFKNRNVDNSSSYESYNFWPVNNWDMKFLGPITLRIAFEFSRNIPFMNFLWTPENIKPFSQFLSLFDLFDPNQQQIYPAIILGSVNIKPLTLLSALHSFFHNRKYTIDPIISVTRSGQNLEQEVNNFGEDLLIKTKKTTSNPSLGLKYEAIYGVLSMMKGAVARGSCVRLRELGPHIYAKTGSSGKNKDGYVVVLYGRFLVSISICRYDHKSIAPNESFNTVLGSGYPVEVAKVLLKYFNPEPVDYLSIMKSKYGDEIKTTYSRYNLYNSEELKEKDQILDTVITEEVGEKSEEI